MSQITGLLKREIPMLVVSALIVAVMANAFFDIPALSPVTTEGIVWANIVAGFALYLGGISLALHHIRKVSRRSPDWIFSIVVLATYLITLIVGFGYGTSSEPYVAIYQNIQITFQQGMISFLGILLIQATFRSYRVHNIEATLLLISFASQVMMNAPVFEIIWAGFPVIGNWFAMYPNAVVKSGLRLVIGLGTLAWTLQLLVGRETRWVGEVMGGAE
jgi:anaerobic C4-dicarboxylate transporter